MSPPLPSECPPFHHDSQGTGYMHAHVGGSTFWSSTVHHAQKINPDHLILHRALKVRHRTLTTLHDKRDRDAGCIYEPQRRSCPILVVPGTLNALSVSCGSRLHPGPLSARISRHFVFPDAHKWIPRTFNISTITSLPPHLLESSESASSLPLSLVACKHSRHRWRDFRGNSYRVYTMKWRWVPRPMLQSHGIFTTLRNTSHALQYLPSRSSHPPISELSPGPFEYRCRSSCQSTCRLHLSLEVTWTSHCACFFTF